MPQVPAFAILKEKFPNQGDVGAIADLVGGMVQKNLKDEKYTDYKNTCAIRVSHALNLGGDPIDKGGGKLTNKYAKDKKIRTDDGTKGHYIYSVYDLEQYLTGRFGAPKPFDKSTTQAQLAKANIKGIILFAYWHADLWDGTTCLYHNAGFGQSKVQQILIYPSAG